MCIVSEARKGLPKTKKGSCLTPIAKEDDDTFAECWTDCLGTIDRFIAPPFVFAEFYVLFMHRKFRLRLTDGHDEVILVSVNHYRGKP